MGVCLMQALHGEHFGSQKVIINHLLGWLWKQIVLPVVMDIVYISLPGTMIMKAVCKVP